LLALFTLSWLVLVLAQSCAADDLSEYLAGECGQARVRVGVRLRSGDQPVRQAPVGRQQRQQRRRRRERGRRRGRRRGSRFMREQRDLLQRYDLRQPADEHPALRSLQQGC
jgi:hypothetical protein